MRVECNFRITRSGRVTGKRKRMKRGKRGKGSERKALGDIFEVREKKRGREREREKQREGPARGIYGDGGYKRSEG